MGKRTPEPTDWARGELEEIAWRLDRGQVDEALLRADEFQRALAERVATVWAGHGDAPHLLELSRKVDAWLRDLLDDARAKSVARQMKREITPEP